MNSTPVITFPPGCRTATLLQREKRFSLLVDLDGILTWAYTNNTGSMMGLVRPGRPIFLSPALHPARKLPWTAEALKTSRSVQSPWIGVNTSVPNRFLGAAFQKGLLSWASGYTTLKREATYGESRLDGLLTGEDLPPLWVECKNVSMVEDDRAAFPDAISERARKHLGTLSKLRKLGHRAVMLYIIQRPDACCFGPADYIDPAYAVAFRRALEEGIEAYAYTTIIQEQGIFMGKNLPLAF